MASLTQTDASYRFKEFVFDNDHDSSKDLADAFKHNMTRLEEFTFGS